VDQCRTFNYVDLLLCRG